MMTGTEVASITRVPGLYARCLQCGTLSLLHRAEFHAKAAHGYPLGGMFTLHRDTRGLLKRMAPVPLEREHITRLHGPDPTFGP